MNNGRPMLLRTYTTLSLEELERDRMAREQALPGFPYISHKGAQACMMAYGFKIVSRDNVVNALYTGEGRSEKSRVDMSNKVLRDVANKGFLERHMLDHEVGNLYSLGELGFEYLGVDAYDTNFKRRDLLRFYQVNRVFNTLCSRFRQDYTIEWATDPEDGIGDARSVVWKDRIKGIKLREDVWVTLRSNFSSQQVEEALEKQKEFTGKNSKIVQGVDIHVVGWNAENLSLKIVENGVKCASKEEIVEWARRG